MLNQLFPNPDVLKKAYRKLIGLISSILCNFPSCKEIKSIHNATQDPGGSTFWVLDRYPAC